MPGDDDDDEDMWGQDEIYMLDLEKDMTFCPFLTVHLGGSTGRIEAIGVAYA